ncbi:3-oxoacyl-[acyl-carrier-protein] synthase III C-terminal domain-containing protein [Streptomyces sp. NPDC006552]|uniref:3-oxoacyl-ACP synthase III family protein n=1 Tax=Streptomyces sp. NPDC006552 TaxID=3157179 RepID=UPI00339E8A79
MGFGVSALGYQLGEEVPVLDVAAEYTDDMERVRTYASRFMHRSAPGVGLTDLSYEATRKALDGAGVRAGQIDLLVLAVTDLTEYLYWDAAASLLHRLGADGAEAVLLTQACSSGVAGFDLVAGKFATHPEYRTAVVVAASRVAEPYWNRLETGAGCFSDGAVAAVVRRDHDELRWRAGEITTDGTHVDFFRLEAGGAAVPFGTPEAAAAPPRVGGIEDVKAYFANDTERISAFGTHAREQYRLVVERACKRAGIGFDDLHRLLLPFDNQPAMSGLISALGFPPERTNLALAADYGHLGAADPLFALAREAESDTLRRGDHVALAAVGRGMSWACALFEV